MKRVLRKRLLRKRKTHVPKAAQTKNALILKRVLQLPEFRKAKTVMLYAPIYGEVDTKGIFYAALKQRKRVGLPKVKGEQLEARAVKSWEELGKGVLGVLEPLKHSHALEPSEIGLVFVPGIAFDEEGYRLGYGKGFYDRFLGQVSKEAKKIGLAYEFQVVKRLPREPHDEKVNILITEKRVLRIK